MKRRNRRPSKQRRNSLSKSVRRHSWPERLEDRRLLTSSNGYLQLALAADQSGAALLQDANVQNPWGIALSPQGADLWAVDSGSGVATRYLGDVNGSPFTAHTPAITIPGTSPTAIAFNPTGDFIVGTGQNALPALFLFASQDGTISGWASAPSSTQAQTGATVSGAEFTGLAVAVNGTSSQLYAADFHNAKIDVFNGSFGAVTLPAGAFTDPNLPTGYAPYNIQLVGNQLYVTYALQNANKTAATTGAGDGLIDIYNLDGTFAKRLVSNGGQLNAPWGLAMAPSSSTVGDFAGDLLVANTGDGHILAYDPSAGSFVGMLNNGPGTTSPITISGLHGLAFGNGSQFGAGDTSTLFYTAGSGQHGQIGEIVNAFDRPLVVVPTAISASEGSTFSGTIATFSDSNTTAAASSFTALVDWGDNSGQTTATVTANSNGGFNVTASHLYAEDVGIGPVKIIVSDAQAHNITATSSATVSETDFTATATTVSVSEGQSFSGSVGTFNDADDAGNASKFVASINWGDGSSATTTTPVANGDTNFSVTGSHTYADEGTFTITTTISEIGGTTSSPTTGAIGAITSTAVVAEADSFTGTATAISATEGTTFSSGTLATFTDSDTTTPASDLTATIDWGDGTSDTVAPSGSGGNFTVAGSHVYSDEGTFSGVKVTLAEKSPGTASASATTTATVAEGDSFTGTAQTVTASQAATVSGGTVATFTDTNHATTAGQLTATINWGDGSSATTGTVTGSNGSFSVAGDHTYTASGTYTVSATISENSPGSASGTVTNSSAVVLDTDFTASAASVSSPTEGTALATTTSLGTFADPDGSTSASDYTATINWGDGTSATTASVAADGSGGFSVTGGHTYADEGAFTATVMVSLTGTLVGIFSNTISVADADTTLTGTGTPVSATEQSSFTGQIATFTDNNTSADPADFTAVIDWGDGTSATTTSVTGSGGTLTVSGTHTYADEGTFTPVVVLSDPGGTSATATATATVADADKTLTAAPGTISVSEGTAFSGNVATFTDNDTTTPATDFTATVDWGDGKTTTTSVTGSAGSFTVPGTHTYADDGTYTVKVTIADDSTGAATATATFTATVAEIDLSGTADSFTTTEGQTFSGTVATFTDAGSPDTGANYTATIAWGDGNTSTSVPVSNVNGNLVVSGSHVYADEGTYTTSVQITETDASATASASGVVTVAEADSLTATAVSATATEGTSFNGNLATFTDTDTSTPASDFSVTIDWGDGTSATTGSVSGSAGNFVVQGSHTYFDEGTFSAIVTIHDKQGTAAATVTASATVAEADVLTGTATPISATSGAAFSGTVATFTDTNSAAVGGDFTANIDWGDGHTSTGSVSASNGTLTVSGSHVYTQSGIENVKVTLTDDSPGTASATATATATVSTASLSATGVPVNVTQGTTVSNATVATFTDSSGNQPVSNYTATIDWGDGTTSTGTIAANSGGSGFTVTGSHTYLAPGNDTLKITISATGGVSTQAVTTATVGSATERFVAQVYRDLLKREPDPQGEQYWTNLIASGHTRAEEVLNIERSIEYRTDVVNDIFEMYLHRPADPTAMNLSTQLLLISTPEQLSEVVVSSPEYYQNRGGGTSQGFLNALYTDALNRPVDSAAQAATTHDDFNNMVARQQVAAAVFGGNEFLSDLVSSPTARPTNPFGGQPTIGWYQAYLHRNAGSSEVSQNVSSLHSGSNNFQVVANIIGSDEYFAQFGT